MKFLLLFLGISFFFIFFLLSSISFSSGSLLWNVFIEAHVYIILSILLIVKVLKNDFSKKRKEKVSKKWNIFSFFSFDFILPLIKTFFWKYLYYIACIFFYISIFLLLHVILWEVDIPKMFLLFNSLILFLYFIENKLHIFQNFLRINTITISIYYIISQVLYLYGYWEILSYIDILNIIFIFFLLCLFLFSSRWKHYTPVIASYLIFYIFLEYLVIIYFFFQDIKIWASLFTFVVSIIFLIKTSTVSKTLFLNKELIRSWWLVFNFIFIYFASEIIFSWATYSLVLLPAVLWSSVILFSFHKKFQNYISLLVWSLWIVLFFYGIYSFFLPDNQFFTYICFLFFFISLIFLLIKQFYSLNYYYDSYFFQIFSLLVNLSWVVYFFFFMEISILTVALLFLWESIYLFFLYYNFRKRVQNA